LDIGGDGGARGFQDLSSDCLVGKEAESGVSTSGGVSGMAERKRGSRAVVVNPIERDVLGVGGGDGSVCDLGCLSFCPCHSLLLAGGMVAKGKRDEAGVRVGWLRRTAQSRGGVHHAGVSSSLSL
jgi:hypothetical protein